MPAYRAIRNWPLPEKKNIIGNQALQRKMIQRERQVELAMEGQRYFDIRRWMICGPGEDADQSVFHAMNMNGFKDKPAGDPKSISPVSC